MNKNFIKGLVLSVVVSGSAFAQSAPLVSGSFSIVKPINVCAAVQSQLDQCTADKAAMQVEFDNLDANYQSVLSTLAGTQAALDSCTASLLAGDGQAAVLMTQVQSLEVEKAALEIENAELKATIEGLKVKIELAKKAATIAKKNPNFKNSKSALKTVKKALQYYIQNYNY